ncbi:TPA: DEAD/DEAH box helicase family protein [Candidatus Woesearchaeota archaeon]|nr:DEAD/DEAH box helicase family protein [Candidatus Woesearchaeota archaeon]
MIDLRDYQKKAVESLKAKVQNVLNTPDNEVVIFQAPTGSGKTVMVSEMLKQLVKENHTKYSFVWVSVRMLHEQSKEKLEKYYEDDRLIQCSYFEDLEDRQIGENEILFINWHSINKKDINIYVRENEQDNNLNALIQNTKEEGRQIILIIDESHHTASSEKSKELIETIGPKVTIEVSATPHLKENVSEIEKVHISQVKAEEMIKSEIAVNPEFLEIKTGTKSSDELIIEQALKKRQEVAKLYEKEGSNINPLVLIQLPDKKSNLINKKDDVVKILKDKFKITEENGKLAVWLSEEKTDNLANVDKNDNEVDVLVFKQAIALGWDCPRAQILVIFRESKSFTFTIQTIGRIMRMPELKYYNEEDLNKGYVFTNLPNIEITEDYAKDYVTVYEAKRDSKLYKDIYLPSIFLKRQRERTRLSGKFGDIFMKVAEETKLQKKITAQPSRIVSPIIADGKIVNIDQLGEIERKGQIEVQLNLAELQQLFDKFIADNCTPYAPSDSSDRMKTALYNFFTEKYKLRKFDPQAQRIVLGKENVQAFVDAINIAKERYKKEVVEQLNEKREKKEIPKWEIPVIISYNSRYSKEEQPTSIMKPFYTKKPSEPERRFIELLNKSKKAKWWFKNGEAEAKYFAVPYTDENGIERAFYVDFIVLFTDGSTGLFDTKSGMTAKEAGPRAEGLQKYLKKNKDKKVWGGIAIFVNGTWRYNDNDKEKYEYNPNDLSSWKIIEI